MSAIPQINVSELAQKLALCDPQLQLMDVREPEEVAIAYIDGFVVLPLTQFEEWSQHIKSRFNPEAETLVICHHGVRSNQMCHWLRNNGFTNVKNIVGGIDAYSVVIDASIRRY